MESVLNLLRNFLRPVWWTPFLKHWLNSKAPSRLITNIVSQAVEKLNGMVQETKDAVQSLKTDVDATMITKPFSGVQKKQVLLPLQTRSTILSPTILSAFNKFRVPLPSIIPVKKAYLSWYRYLPHPSNNCEKPYREFVKTCAGGH